MYLLTDERPGLASLNLTVPAPQTAVRARPPGGGYATRTAVRGLQGLTGLSQCVPVPVVLADAASIRRAVANNRRYANSLGWRPLRDQIEVNLLGCARVSPRLGAVDFAQAVARFQRNGRLTVDGMLGPTTWRRMQALRVEREPFPRHGLTQDFNSTPNAFACEAHVHPGIDVDVPAGTPIPVVAGGIVRYAGIVGVIRRCATARGCQAGGAANVCNFLSYGRAVIVEHPDRGPGKQPGGDSVYTIYAHVRFRGRHRVSSGEPVRAGRIIGEVGAGCVGFSGGPHLHYGVVTGPRSHRLTAGGPARCQICADAYCRAASCPRCNFRHFWDVVTPQRPRTTVAAGFRW